MAREHVIYIVVAAILILVIATLVFAVLIQRRRQRIMLLLALAQEDANRRRKRRRTGLRRCEVDAACPEAVITQVSDKVTNVAIYPIENSQPENEKHFNPSNLTPPPAVHDPEVVSFASDAPEFSFTYHDDASTGIGDVSNPTISTCNPADENISLQGNASSVALNSSENQTEISTDQEKSIVPSLSYLLVLPTSQETCAVCLDNMEVGSRVRALPCNHVYHSTCIRSWLRRKNACPCCCEKVFTRSKKRPPTPPRTPPPTTPTNESQPPIADAIQIPATDRLVDRSELTSTQFPSKASSIGAIEVGDGSFSQIGSVSSSQFDEYEGTEPFDRDYSYGRSHLARSSAASDGDWNDDGLNFSNSEKVKRIKSDSASREQDTNTLTELANGNDDTTVGSEEMRKFSDRIARSDEDTSETNSLSLNKSRLGNDKIGTSNVH